MDAQHIITALANVKLAASLWEKGELRRIYINGVGYNTKKATQKLWLDLNTMTVHAKTDCPSQDSAWCDSQSRQLVEQYEAKIMMAILPASEFNVKIVDADTDQLKQISSEGAKSHIRENYTISEDSYTEFDDEVAKVYYKGRCIATFTYVEDVLPLL